MPQFLVHISHRRGGYDDFIIDALSLIDARAQAQTLFASEIITVQEFSTSMFPKIFGSNRPHFHSRINSLVGADGPTRGTNYPAAPKAYPDIGRS